MVQPTRHAEIADALTRDILLGQYRPGERLPSERDLSARFTANRGAVREAMKQLEQLGLADIQPGGARVRPLASASLDVVPHLLRLTQPPDAALVDQLMQVIHSLVRLAAEQTLRDGSSAEIAAIRNLLKPLLLESCDPDSHQQLRLSVMGAFMHASGNLPLQLIANALVDQLEAALRPLHGLARLDHVRYANCAAKLDEALAQRDTEALRLAFEAFIELNRATLAEALSAAHTPDRRPSAAIKTQLTEEPVEDDT